MNWAMEEHFIREDDERLSNEQEHINYHEEVVVGDRYFYFFLEDEYRSSYLIDVNDESNITFVRDLTEYERDELFEQINDYLIPESEDALMDFYENII